MKAFNTGKDMLFLKDVFSHNFRIISIEDVGNDLYRIKAERKMRSEKKENYYNEIHAYHFMNQLCKKQYGHKLDKLITKK